MANRGPKSAAAPPARIGARWRRRAIVAAAALALCWLGSAALVLRFAETLGPLDLGPAGQRSTVVLDREGRLLRPFATADGRWRLPVEPDEVDPLFLAMLKAYEDSRFESHRGVDPLALARAGAQFLRKRRVVSGGSTLTMQVARLLEPRAGTKPRRETPPDRARGPTGALSQQGPDPPALPCACALRRQPRGCARREPCLFRTRAEAPLLRRGGVARGAAAGPGGSPPRPFPRVRASRPKPRARRRDRQGGNIQRPRRRPRNPSACRPSATPFR